MIEIIECVCSVLSLVVSIVSLFMVSSIKNNVKIRARKIKGPINIEQHGDCDYE